MAIKKYKIAVTGADGFIGKKLCQTLKDRKYEVIEYTLNNFDIRKEVEIPGDIDVLFHLAAVSKPYLSKQNPAETFRTNVLGTLNLLEAVRKSNVKKIIFASSILVYKNLTKTKETDLAYYNGVYPYGLEKIIGEEYIKIYSQLYGIDYTLLRISGVYGPGMYKNPIFDLIHGFLNNNVRLYINKNSVYNFVYIDDAVDALIKSLKWKNDIINLSSDENIKIIDIYNFLSKTLKKRIDIKDSDFLIKIIGNNKKIRKKLWKEKYNLKKGLLKTYNYFLKQDETKK